MAKIKVEKRLQKKWDALPLGDKPPLISIDGRPLSVGDTVYIVDPPGYRETPLPMKAKIVEIDLSQRRFARLQLHRAGECHYYADRAAQEKHTARKLYHDPKEALQDALAPFHAALNEARKELDGKRRAYDKAKEALRDATHWKP